MQKKKSCPKKGQLFFVSKKIMNRKFDCFLSIVLEHWNRDYKNLHTLLVCFRATKAI